MLNNVGYALAVEKLLGIAEKIPERAQYIRVIVGEMSRITDHLTCLGAGAMELGAFTVFLYVLKAREWIYELLEEVSGARLTHSYVRIGGVRLRSDRPTSPRSCATILERIDATCSTTSASCSTATASSATAWTASAIITQDDALAYGWTGPAAALDGLDYDVRKDHPYLVYDRFDFDVPVGSVRRQLRPLRRARRGDQAVDAHPRAGARADPRRPGRASTIRASSCRPRARSTTRSKAMIAHFKIIMDGINVPPGEVYSFTEGGNGELGFYIVSDGTGPPLEVPRAPALLRHRRGRCRR